MNRKLIYTLLFNILLCQSWEIEPSKSYIEYSGEHSLHSWTGKTNEFDFNMPCKGSFCSLEISIPIENFDSGNDGRDSNMLYYTESLLYPSVSFVSDYFSFAGDFNTTMELTGQLTFHGITKEITVKVELYENQFGTWGQCEFDISLNFFDVDRPSLLLKKISDGINVTAKFKFLTDDDEK